MAKKSYQVDNHIDVTPSDDNLLPTFAAYLSAEEGEGFIRVTLPGAADDLIGNSVKLWFNQGVLRPIQVKKVWAADTTALGIKAFFDSNAGV